MSKQLREATQEVLAALELHGEQYPHMVKGYTTDATTALRAALAEPERQPMTEEDLSACVDRFLTWPLPKSFAPDCGISFDGRKDDEWNKNKTWPVGTNLFTAIEARQMLAHVLGIPAEIGENMGDKNAE